MLFRWDSNFRAGFAIPFLYLVLGPLYGSIVVAAPLLMANLVFITPNVAFHK